MTGAIAHLVRGSLIYGLGQALGRSVPLLLMPVLTAHLDPASYGLLAILIAMSLMLTAVFSVGLGAATAPSYFDQDGSRSKGATIWTAFAILCVSSCVMTAAGVVFAKPIAAVLLGDDRHDRLVILTVGASAFGMLSTPFRQYLMFEQKPLHYVCLSLVALLVSIGLTVWLVVGRGRGLSGVLEADLIGQAATCALLALPGIRGTRFEIRKRLARDLISLGLPLIPGFAALFVLQHGSRYLLQWLDGPATVGIYAVGVNIAAIVGLFVAGFQSAWVPYFMSYASRPGEARSAFGRVMTYYVMSVGTVSLLLYVCARPLVMILAAPEYRGAEYVVGFAATTQFLSGLFLVLLPGIYFARRVRDLALLQGGTGGVAVALNIALIPAWGYVGSALAGLFSYVLLCGGQYVWNERRGYLRGDYEWQRLRRFGVLYAAVALLSLWPRDLSLVVEAALSSAAAIVLLRVIGGWLTRNERTAIRDTLRYGPARMAAHRPAEIR